MFMKLRMLINLEKGKRQQKSLLLILLKLQSKLPKLYILVWKKGWQVCIHCVVSDIFLSNLTINWEKPKSMLSVKKQLQNIISPTQT